RDGHVTGVQTCALPISFVPTAAERRGDFSGTAGQLVDPAARQPFPGNQIPASLIVGPSKYFLDKIPLPNGPGQQLTYRGPAAVRSEERRVGKGGRGGGG